MFEQAKLAGEKVAEKLSKKDLDALREAVVSGARLLHAEEFANLGVDAVKQAARTAHYLQVADTYLVADQMMDLVLGAAVSLPSTSLSRLDLPSPFGFVVLPQPVPISVALQDVKPHSLKEGDSFLSVDGYAWADHGEYVRVICFSVPKHQPQDFHDFITLNDNEHHLLRGVLGERYLSSASWTLKYEEMLWFSDKDEALKVAQSYWDMEASRWLVAFWALCRQTFGEVTHASPDRASSRRWYRAFKAEPRVRVVKLRRHKGPSDGHGDVEWHHRWIVRGHWRQQPYGPGRSLVKAVWIAPYVKGPEGAPLLSTDKVNVLIR
jgi:hypothetical protein